MLTVMATMTRRPKRLASVRRLTRSEGVDHESAGPASPVTAYVVNTGSGTVTPIVTATNTAGPPMPVGTDPGAIAITPDGKTVYVLNRGSDTVIPIATATNTASPAITVGTDPEAIAITPDAKTAYVTNGASDTVTPIATSTNTPGPPIPVGSGPDDMTITPDGTTIYVASVNAGTVTPIATATDTAGPPITIGFDANNIAITPDGKTAYVARGGNFPTVIPITTARLSARASSISATCSAPPPQVRLMARPQPSLPVQRLRPSRAYGVPTCVNPCG